MILILILILILIFWFVYFFLLHIQPFVFFCLFVHTNNLIKKAKNHHDGGGVKSFWIFILKIFIHSMSGNDAKDEWMNRRDCSIKRWRLHDSCTRYLWASYVSFQILVMYSFSLKKKRAHTQTMSILDSEILHFQNAKNWNEWHQIQFKKKNYSNNKNSQNFHRHQHYHYEIYTSDNLWIITRAEPPLLPPQLPLLLLKKKTDQINNELN